MSRGIILSTGRSSSLSRSHQQLEREESGKKLLRVGGWSFDADENACRREGGLFFLNQ